MRRFAAGWAWSALAVVGVSLATATAAAEESARARDEAHTEPNSAALHGGAVLLGAIYAVTAGAAATHELSGGTGWLLLPVAGPWIGLSTGTDINPWGLALSGAAQAAGAALLTHGALHPRTVLGPAQARTPPAPDMRPDAPFSPAIDPTRQFGVSVAATF